MENMIRPRGRPRGSSKLNPLDHAFLTRAADLLIASPGLKPTAAFRQLAPKASDADIHRWQEKWRAKKKTMLAEAEERRSARERAATAARARTAQAASFGALGHTLAMLEKLRNPPWMSAFRQIQDSSFINKIASLPESPTMKMIREMQDSPMMKALRGAESSPIIKQIKEMRDLYAEHQKALAPLDPALARLVAINRD